jgi:hypothetical protein
VGLWLVLFPWSLKVVSEPPSNVRSCGTGALHDMALMRTLKILEGEFVTPRSHIGKMRRSPYRMGIINIVMGAKSHIA